MHPGDPGGIGQSLVRRPQLAVQRLDRRQDNACRGRSSPPDTRACSGMGVSRCGRNWSRTEGGAEWVCFADVPLAVLFLGDFSGGDVNVARRGSRRERAAAAAQAAGSGLVFGDAYGSGHAGSLPE
ncbi:MAG: hypothetical protein MUQ10_13880 [Anaerolineae bacterium]|nr:hypothetical protein [Anaerolineae bacterium]